MKIVRKKNRLVFFLICFLILISIIAIYMPHPNYHDTLNHGTSDDERLLEIHGQQKIVMEIAEKRGIPAALDYINSTVIQNAPYANYHMVLHGLGHMAFYKTHNLSKALEYLPSYNSSYYYWNYDGYIHGAMMAFFSLESQYMPINDLMHQACGSYFNIALSEYENFTYFEQQKVLGCFHSIGHGIMASNENDVYKSLAYCDYLPQNYMQIACYHGVFMENYFLHMSSYLPGSPRPNVISNLNISLLCDDLDEKYKTKCYGYRAWVLILNGSNIKTSLDSCYELDLEYQSECIVYPARYSITEAYMDNLTKMNEICMSLKQNYQPLCINSVASGLKRGAGGRQNRNALFCEIVDPKFKQGCLETEVSSLNFISPISK